MVSTTAPRPATVCVLRVQGGDVNGGIMDVGRWWWCCVLWAQSTRRPQYPSNSGGHNGGHSVVTPLSAPAPVWGLRSCWHTAPRREAVLVPASLPLLEFFNFDIDTVVWYVCCLWWICKRYFCPSVCVLISQTLALGLNEFIEIGLTHTF